MRNLFPVVRIMAFAALSANSQETASEGLACFENLAVPEYPNAALQAGVDGSVWTWTQVSPQGAIDKIQNEVVSPWGNAPKLLVPPVEKALRAAKIKPQCAGKTVAVIFHYQLHGEPIPEPKVTSKKEGPNLIWIESRPAAAVPTAVRRP